MLLNYLLALVAVGLCSAAEVCHPPCGCFNDDPPFDDRPLPSDWQEDTITWLLFPKDGDRDQPIELEWPNVVTPPEFDPSKPTVFTIHGWTDDRDHLNIIRDAYLDHLDYNLIVVEWTGASSLYPRAASNTQVTGACTAYMARQLTNNQTDTVQCVGHSLGAHACGYMGKSLKDGNQPLLGRITGLDAAGSYFAGDEVLIRLDRTDAIFVDNIHTDAGSAGIGQAISDVDFFPNKGYNQPGCGVLGCSSHQIVLNFLAASISGKSDSCNFDAVPCESEDDADNGDCDDCEGDDCQMMGHYAADLPGRGIYYLTTVEDYPYCVS